MSLEISPHKRSTTKQTKEIVPLPDNFGYGRIEGIPIAAALERIFGHSVSSKTLNTKRTEIKIPVDQVPFMKDECFTDVIGAIPRRFSK